MPKKWILVKRADSYEPTIIEYTDSLKALSDWKKWERDAAESYSDDPENRHGFLAEVVYETV